MRSKPLICKGFLEFCLWIAYPLERYRLPAGTVSPTRWNGIAYPLERYRLYPLERYRPRCWNGISHEAFAAWLTS
jgi:hypothetical protein